MTRFDRRPAPQRRTVSLFDAHAIAAERDRYRAALVLIAAVAADDVSLVPTIVADALEGP